MNHFTAIFRLPVGNNKFIISSPSAWRIFKLLSISLVRRNIAGIFEGKFNFFEFIQAIKNEKEYAIYFAVEITGDIKNISANSEIIWNHLWGFASRYTKKYKIFSAGKYALVRFTDNIQIQDL